MNFSTENFPRTISSLCIIIIFYTANILIPGSNHCNVSKMWVGGVRDAIKLQIGMDTGPKMGGSEAYAMRLK